MMRTKRSFSLAAAVLLCITIGLFTNQTRWKNSFGNDIGVLSRFRNLNWSSEPKEGGVLIEHLAGSEAVVPHKIGMVSMLIGDTNPTYERALRTHLRHGEIQGYETFVLRSNILDLMFNKPMFILDLLTEELRKPFHERLEWLFWFDCDSVLMNPALGLSHFLPPAKFKDTNLLVTNDHNGLNNGVFFIRVCAWSIELMTATLAYRTYHPDEDLPFRDQSVLDRIIHMDKFREQVVYYPQRWFNAYQSGSLSEALNANQARRGDLLVHFAGVPNRDVRMNDWCDIAEQHLPDWEVEIIHTSYRDEISQFWSDKARQDADMAEELKKFQEEVQSLVEQTDAELSEYRQNLTTEEQNKIDTALVEVKNNLGAKFKDKLEGPVDALKNVTSKFDEIEENIAKQTKAEAQTAIITAEKMGLTADHIRELLIGANDPNKIQEATHELQKTIEMKNNATTTDDVDQNSR